MAELRRCLINKKNLLLLFILVLTNITFIFVQCNDTQKITKTGDELVEYIDSYQAYVDSTLENVDKMRILSSLGNKEDYITGNLDKTAKDFSAISGTQLEYGENRGVVIFSEFELTNLLLVGYGVYLIQIFTGEYRKGLSLLVFSTAGGRRKLGLQRIGILALGLTVAAAILYGSSWLTVAVRYPGMNPSRAIQSVPEFMKCTFMLSIGEYMLGVVLVKLLAAFVLSLILYACISLVRNVVAIIICGGLVLAEVLLYKLIIPTSIYNVFKYLNLYGLLGAGDGFRYYYNINLFNKPVTLLYAQLGFGLILMVVAVVLVLIGQGIRPIEFFSVFRQLIDKIARFVQRKKPVLNGFLWEGYKVLVSQFGLIIIAVVFYLAVSASVDTQYQDFRNWIEVDYYRQFAGPVTEEKLNEVRTLEAKYTKYYNNALKNLGNDGGSSGGTSSGSSSSGTKTSSQVQNEMAVNRYGALLDPLRNVLANMESSYEYSQKTGITVHLIEPFSYDMLIKYDNKTFQRNLLYCLIGVVLVFSGIMNYERASNTEMLLHTMPYGRKRIIRNKVLWVVIISLLFSLPIHLIQYYRIAQVFPFEHLDYAVQSVEMFRSFPIRISLRAFIIGMYTLRGLISTGGGIAVMYASRKCKTRVSCIAICTLVIMFVAFVMIAINNLIGGA